MRKGIWQAVAAYVIWGVFPVYWKLFGGVPALDLICHRIIWSSVTLCGATMVSGQWRAVRTALYKPRVVAAYAAAAVLIGVNWLTYIWAVNAGFIIESSLGYFINPIISVLLGVVVLRERLRPWQWLPVGLALAGVLSLAVAYGALPWIALTLAFTFATYGLVKKTSPLTSLQGLTLETCILFVPAFLYLYFFGEVAWLQQEPAFVVLLASTGFVTAVPLLFFSAATHRIPLSLLGILQYISPTMQFLFGVLLYGEPFTRPQLLGFTLVWIGLAIFAVEGVMARRTLRSVQPANEFP